MGYYTKYSLKAQGGSGLVALDLLFERSEEAQVALDLDGRSNERCKWYDHEQDMLELSTFYPDTIFTLHGWGEQMGDEWEKEFKNGEMTIIN